MRNARLISFQEQKDKFTNAGLLTYPILQAADILVYDAKLVPVGQDQLPHLELSREIARRFNHLYGAVLVEPQPLLTQTPKVPGMDGRKKIGRASCRERVCQYV